jgi:hypothetical protein
VILDFFGRKIIEFKKVYIKVVKNIMIRVRYQSQKTGVAPVSFQKDIPIPFTHWTNRAFLSVIINASAVLSCVTEPKTSTEGDSPTKSRGSYSL